MRRARLAFIFLLVLSGCEKAASSHPDTAPSPDSAVLSESLAVSNAERLVRVVRFDCTNDDGATAFPWGQGLRNWKGGGPGGAAWNADRLHCAAELQTPCTSGFISIELHVGSSLAAERSIAFRQAGVQAVRFDLRSESWAAQLDQVGEASRHLPYRSAIFGLTALAACTRPEVFGPGMGPRLEYADQDSFVAGFASGE